MYSSAEQAQAVFFERITHKCHTEKYYDAWLQFIETFTTNQKFLQNTKI